MHFLCSLRLDDGFAPDCEPRLREALAAAGWDAREEGHYVFAVPAVPGAVDGPSLTLGAALRRMRRDHPEEGASPASLACAYRDVALFEERVAVFPLPGQGAGMFMETGAEPLFADSIRLRDAMLTALLSVHRRR